MDQAISTAAGILFFWASGVIGGFLVGYGVARSRARDYQKWLAHQIGRLVVENMRLQEYIQNQRDPADYWKNEE